MERRIENNIKITKGLDICIPGTAEKTISGMVAQSHYALKPSDFVGVTPRLLVAEGDAVKAGTPLFEDKHNPGVPFVSPASGKVSAIVRGEKRALQAIVIESDGEFKSLDFGKANADISDKNVIREKMIESGLWTLLRQRPFGIVPPKDAAPKGVFISAFDSSPLPFDYDFAINGREEDFQKGVDVLHCLTGNVNISINAKRQSNSFFTNAKNAHIHAFEGPHPAGLTGTQIAKIDPINKGESVWTVNPQDVAIIGHLFNSGEYRPTRCIALCGPMVKEPMYHNITTGAEIKPFCSCIANMNDQKVRLISGNVLSGTTIAEDGFICSGDDKVCVLPEGDYYDFMGWLRPNFKKYSFSRTFLSGVLSRFKIHSEKFDFDTGRHGSVRPLFVTGEFEKLVPLDIYPMQLIKACIIGDIELMENLGIYEVEPEDLALCEFADTSKTEIQAIIRNGLEKLRIEN